LVPASFIFAALASNAFGLATASFVIFTVIAYYLFYRISLVLPAVAIGAPLTLKEAWRATSDTGAALILLVLLAFGFSLLAQGVSALLGFAPTLQLIFSIAVEIGLVAMINISILTTLYGVLVERRDLA
jgi:hypothetical protein